MMVDYLFYETICIILSRGRQAGRGGWPGFAGFFAGRVMADSRQNGEAAHFSGVPIPHAS